MTSPLRFSFIPRAKFHGDVTDTRGTFDALEARLRRDGDTIADKEGAAIVVSAFNVGDGTTSTTRGRRGRFRQEPLIAETWLMGLDFDTRPGDALEIAAPLKAAGLDVLLYSSHSHGRLTYFRDKVRKELAEKLEGDELDRAVERRATAPRFRVLVRLTRSVTPTEYRAVFRWLDRYCGGGSDTSVGEPVRLFYTPRRKAPDAVVDPWIVRWRGEGLDPDALPDGLTVVELIADAERAGAPAPRSRLANAEVERRALAVSTLAPKVRTRLEAKAARILSETLAGLERATVGKRRMGMFAAGARIGEWSKVLGVDGVEHWRRKLLNVTRFMPDPEDHARQIENGIRAGAANLIDPGEEVTRKPKALPIISDGADAVDLDDARVRVAEIMAEALADGGPHAIAADPGVGKTTLLLEQIPALWQAGQTLRVALPTNKLAGEVLREAKRIAVALLPDADARAFLGGGGHDPLIGIEPKRHAQNCQNFAAVNAGRRAGGIDGARQVCGGCNLHPTNSGSWTACSFFLETMQARDYRVTITTHALEIQKAKARNATTVDLAAFRKAAKGAGRVRPGARWEADGLVLLPVPDENGTEAPTLEGKGDEVEAQCRAWLAEADGLVCADDLETLRRKLAPTATAATDLLVIDENPRAADEKRTVRAKDLVLWRGAGDVVVSDDVAAALADVMADAKVAGDARGPEALALAAPPDSLTVRRTDDGAARSVLGARLVAEWAPTAATGAIPTALADAPEADALEALEAACRRGWSGCYVDTRGVLHLTHALELGHDAARATVYMDGTATEASAKALFGPRCRFSRVAVKLHPDTRIVRVDWSAASRALPVGDDDDDVRDPVAVADKRRRRGKTLQRLEAAVRRWESPTTAWVLHKAWCDDDDVRALLPEALEAGRVTYFRAPEATGSNRLAGCTRIVLADWFVPRAATVATAQTLEARADGMVEADWLREARHQTEGAEIVQAAYRVRPVQNAREIVLLSERETPAHWPTAEVIDPDELVADELGVLPAGRKGAAMLLTREVAARGAVAVESRFKATPHLASINTGEQGRGPETALQRASAHWRDHGRALGWAEAAGVAVAYVRTSDGGAGLPVFFAPGRAPDAATVAALLASPPRWLEWQGVRLEIEDATGPVLEEVRRLPSRDGATFDALAESLGVSTSTIRRRLQSVGIRSTDELRAYWERARTPDHVDTPDGGVALAGSPAWLHLASDGDTRRWREVTGTPWPAGGRTEGGCKRSGACRLTAAPWPDERSDWAV